MIAWLMATPAAQKGIAYGAMALAGVIAIWRVFAAGKKSAQVDGLKEQVKNGEVRATVDDRVTRANNSERKRLRDKWTRGQVGL